jgi:hypothetical protein
MKTMQDRKRGMAKVKPKVKMLCLQILHLRSSLFLLLFLHHWQQGMMKILIKKGLSTPNIRVHFLTEVSLESTSRENQNKREVSNKLLPRSLLET